jgi:Tfp pilus assembly pilus retraction ATPase PilT
VKKKQLEENLSVDFAFNLVGSTQRFRANVFMQQGSYSFVIRTLWKTIPSFEQLKIHNHPNMLKG